MKNCSHLKEKRYIELQIESIMIMIVIIRKNRNFHIAILNHPDIPSENKQTRYFDMEISTTKNCIKTLRDSGQILESQKRKKVERI